MRSRTELKRLAAKDVQFKERLARSDELVIAVNAVSRLIDLLPSCKDDFERANVQRAIDEGKAECERLAERVLQVDVTPQDIGNA